MANTGSNSVLKFEIFNYCGTLSSNSKNWSKELNIVSWNGNEPKYDLREWDENHNKMSKGITITEEELWKLHEIIHSEKGIVEDVYPERCVVKEANTYSIFDTNFKDRIIDTIAEQLIKNIADEIVNDLIQMHDPLSNSEYLENVWENICFQCQVEEYFTWQAYEDTIDALVINSIEKLSDEEKMAIYWSSEDFDVSGIEDDASDISIYSYDKSVIHNEIYSKIIRKANNYESINIEKEQDPEAYADEIEPVYFLSIFYDYDAGKEKIDLDRVKNLEDAKQVVVNWIDNNLYLWEDSVSLEELNMCFEDDECEYGKKYIGKDVVEDDYSVYDIGSAIQDRVEESDDFAEIMDCYKDYKEIFDSSSLYDEQKQSGGEPPWYLMIFENPIDVMMEIASGEYKITNNGFNFLKVTLEQISFLFKENKLNEDIIKLNFAQQFVDELLKVELE